MAGMDLKLLVLAVVVLVLCIAVDNTDAKACAKKADVAILLDASGSIGRKRWPLVVQFAALLVDNFQVAEDGSHVAIIVYSNNAKAQVKFNTFAGAELNADNVNQKINEIDYAAWSKFTYIDRALKVADDEVFTPEGGMRDESIPRLAIVFTDGKQTRNKQPYTPLKYASQPLKHKKVEIFSVAVGSAVNRRELRDMASSYDDVFVAGSFDQLGPLAQKLLQRACKPNILKVSIKK